MKEIIEYRDDEFKATITVVSATVLTGIKHDMTINEMFTKLGQANADMQPDEMAERVAKITVWPACYCASQEINIEHKSGKKVAWKPYKLNDETFMQLPEQLTNEWLKLVFKLNPHWNPNELPDEEEEEKKAPKPSSG